MIALIGYKLMENFLRKRRFSKALPYITGKRVLDFGGNRGELKNFLPKNVEYDYINDISFDKTYDNIVCLAVLEHIHYHKVMELFKKFYYHLEVEGTVIITTPTIESHFILDIMSRLRITDRPNLLEHKFYWRKDYLQELAEANCFEIIKYEKFQFGLNQLCIMRKINK